MSKSNLIVIVVLLIIIVVVGFITFGSGGSGSNEAQKIGERLQPNGELPYTDIDGNPVDLASFEGKTLVINAWATWCPFCVNELPDLAELGTEFNDQDVVVIAINRGESANTARAYVETKLNTPEDIVFLLDDGDTFYKSIGGFSMPETVFYREDGSVAVHKRGFMALEEMRQHVETALTTAE